MAMERDWGKFQLAVYGALTVASVAYWVYYVVVLYPQLSISYVYWPYYLLEFLVQPLFYTVFSALLAGALRRTGKLCFAGKTRHILFSAAAVLLALYGLGFLLMLLGGEALRAWYAITVLPMVFHHEELFLIPGVLWGLGVPGLDEQRDY